MRILIYGEAEPAFTAHCLELDVVSQGDTVELAVEEVLTAIRTFNYLVERGKVKLPGPAPTETHERFEAGQEVVVPQTDVEVRFG